MNENDSTLERPDANSLTGYIVTYKSTLTAVTHHHFFNVKPVLHHIKKSKEYSSPDCMLNDKLKTISIPNPQHDKIKISKPVTSVVFGFKNDWILLLENIFF